jgi:MOSC domain-containing protein YiiM
MGILAGIARRDGKREPMQTLEQATISRLTGVADDSRGKPGKRQVTLLAADAWRAACAEAGTDAAWTTRRSNLLIEGLTLPREAGHIIAIGDVRLRTTVEVDPCSRMDEQVPGLTSALRPDWRGGIGCEVIEEGSVRVGDEVRILACSSSS